VIPPRNPEATPEQEAERLRRIHSHEHPAMLPGTYRCPVCSIVWWLRGNSEMQMNCGVIHAMGDCCHYGETAWVARG